MRIKKKSLFIVIIFFVFTYKFANIANVKNVKCKINTNENIAGYTPIQIRHAYGFDKTKVNGKKK
ncbi:hypothetical protein P9J83_13560 [Clostridium sporogenes]|uniref:Uncharacterized protein n=1 Tax=Clostridium sporogenes TaxID=1509 RepID=A0AAE4FMJ5_CLOSG|nr:hypothetical protein [Clostridium sporogenes]MDS1004518.1 hypothetical protein [Clostridium sporogenes]